MARLPPLCQGNKIPPAFDFQTWFDFLQLYVIGVFELFRQWYFNIFFRRIYASDPLEDFHTVNPVVLITGATSGIGRQLLLQLTRGGADVIALTHGVRNTFIPQGCIFVPVDLNSRSSTEQAVTKIESILSTCHPKRKVVMFQCAGVYYPNQIGTSDGPSDPVTQTLNINLLMPCLLTQRLSQSMSGLIWLGSSAQKVAPRLMRGSCPLDVGTTPYSMYPLTKLLNVIYAEQWGIHDSKPVAVIHPGIVASHLYQSEHGMVGVLLRALMPYCAWSAEYSAQRVLHLLQSVSFWKRLQGGAHLTETRRTSIYYDAVSMAEAALPSQVETEAGRAYIAEKLFKVIDKISQRSARSGVHESCS